MYRLWNTIVYDGVMKKERYVEVEKEDDDDTSNRIWSTIVWNVVMKNEKDVAIYEEADEKEDVDNDDDVNNLSHHTWVKWDRLSLNIIKYQLRQFSLTWTTSFTFIKSTSSGLYYNLCIFCELLHCPSRDPDMAY